MPGTMVEIVLKTLISKIWAKFDLLVLRPIEWRFWKQDEFGAVQMDKSNVEHLTQLLGYTFKNEQDKAFFEHRFSGYEVHLENVLLDGTNGWVVSGRSIHSLSFFNINDPYDGKKRYPPMLPMAYAKFIGPPTETGDVLWLPKLWNNYYHFVVELLPVLLSLKKQGRQVTVLCRDFSQYAYVHFFIKQFELESSVRFKMIDPKGVYHASKVILLKRPLLEDAFLQEIARLPLVKSVDDKIKIDCIFIYRKGLRSLSNNDEVLSKFMQLGFYCFDPGDYDLETQIDVLSNAVLVVGVHGAGLTNILFAKGLKKLIEIMPGNMQPNHYREIAIRKGAYYQCIKGSALDKNGQFHLDFGSLFGVAEFLS